VLEKLEENKYGFKGQPAISSIEEEKENLISDFLTKIFPTLDFILFSLLLQLETLCKIPTSHFNRLLITSSSQYFSCQVLKAWTRDYIDLWLTSLEEEVASDSGSSNNGRELEGSGTIFFRSRTPSQCSTTHRSWNNSATISRRCTSRITVISTDKIMA
jgi:hypothetical protein